MTRLFPLPLLLAGCLTAEPLAEATAIAPDELEGTWRAAQPQGLLDLVVDPHVLLGDDPLCPTLVEDETGSTWTGGCMRDDGAWIEGRLQQIRGTEELWLVADRFAVVGTDGLEMVVDGGLVQTEAGSLVWLDASMLLCGVHTSCRDGLVGLDLRYGLRLEDDGLIADVAVRGVIGLDGREPASIDGAWRLDPRLCAPEPVDGLLALQSDQRQSIELDGADACDGCATWTVQGTAASAWCPAEL